MFDFILDKNKKYIIFNVNSSSVTGSIVSYNSESEKSIIEYTKDIPVVFYENDQKNFRVATANSLKKVAEALLSYINITENIYNLGQVVIFLSPPWNRKNISIIIDERMESFEARDHYLENFLLEGGQIKEDEVLISSEIISVKANGYNIDLSKLANKKISKLEISLLDSYLKKDNKNFFEEVIGEYFSFSKISFYPFLSVFLNQIKKVYDIKDDFAFLDFTGSIMEFGIFINEQLRSTVLVESGKDKIIREIIKAKIIKNETEGKYILNSYLRGELGQENRVKVESIILTELDYINSEIKKYLSDVGVENLAKKLFVISHGEMNSLIEELNPFSKIYFLGKNYFRNIVETEEDEYLNNFIAVEADFIFNK